MVQGANRKAAPCGEQSSSKLRGLRAADRASEQTLKPCPSKAAVCLAPPSLLAPFSVRSSLKGRQPWWLKASQEEEEYLLLWCLLQWEQNKAARGSSVPFDPLTQVSCWCCCIPAPKFLSSHGRKPDTVIQSFVTQS